MKTLFCVIAMIVIAFALQTDIKAQQLQVNSSFTGPSSVPGGQQFSHMINYSWNFSNTTARTHNMGLKIELPATMEFVSGGQNVKGKFDKATQKWTITITIPPVNGGTVYHPAYTTPGQYHKPTNPFGKGYTDPPVQHPAWSENVGQYQGNGSQSYVLRLKKGTPAGTQCCPVITFYDTANTSVGDMHPPCMTVAP